MSTMTIEVLGTEGCPHADEALELVRNATVGLAPEAEVRLITLATEEEARERRFYGSPTILVDGRDVEGREGPSTGLSQRVYEDEQPLPPPWMIEAALLRALRPRHLLFLCVANSARSQMAEGLARSIAPEALAVSSAGSEPTEVRPEAIAVLEELGIDTSGHWSKAVADLDTSTVDAVITLCADEVCPLYLGQAHRLHWALPDPAAVEDDGAERLWAFRAVRDELQRRLELLLRSK